jgi:hypothetical protein
MKATKRLVKVAQILHHNRKSFETKIDPFFMKKIGQNILDFNHIVKKLAEAEKGTSLMDKVGGAVSGFLGTDPISQIARRMITLAKGYDAMANALIKLGVAMKMLNLKSLSQLGSITRGLSTGQPIKGELQQTQQLSTRKYGEKGEKPLPVVVMKKRGTERMTPEREMQNNIWYVSERLEEAVSLLKKINKNTQTIDEYIEEATNGKIKPPPDLSLK